MFTQAHTLVLLGLLGAVWRGRAHAQDRVLVIGPEQQAVVGQMLGVGEVDLPGPCRLESARIERDRVEARYACRGGVEVALALLPAEAPGEAAARTAKFAVVAGSGASRELVDAVVARLREGEGRFAWTEVPPPAPAERAPSVPRAPPAAQAPMAGEVPSLEALLRRPTSFALGVLLVAGLAGAGFAATRARRRRQGGPP